MISLIAIAILVFAMYFAIKKPVNLVILYTLTAAKDAYGILNLIESRFSPFSFFMQMILFFAAVRLLYLHFTKKQGDIPADHTNLQIIAFLLMVAIVLIALLIRGFDEEFFFAGNFFYSAVAYTPLIFIILLLSADSKELFKALKFIAATQTIIALLVIYFSENNAFLQSISSVNFLSTSKLESVNIGKASFGNLFRVIFDKYSLNQYAHFHNSNVTGFFGATTLFSFIYDAVTQKNLSKRLFSGLLAFCGLLLWANSGMRGPMIGILLGFMVYYCFFTKKSWQRIIVGFFSVVIFLAFLTTEQEQMFAMTGIDVSVATRALRRENAWSFILENPLLGSLGLPAPLTMSNADVHELPLYLAALYGMFAGILYLFIPYIFTSIRMIKHKNEMTFLNWGSFMIVICVSLTNSFTAPTLFWLLLATAVTYDMKEKTPNKPR